MPIFLSPDMPPPRSIILCTTPRSGSTLLCALLASTGVAGRPESWFRAQDRAHYARQWGLPVNPAPAAYLVAAITAGQSPNGTCGLRLQIPSLAPFLVELRTLFGTKPDQELITLALGPAHFLWVRRRRPYRNPS